MRKQFVTSLAVILFIQFASAQSTSIKGTVVDNSEHKNLQHTVISLMRTKDSVLVKFTRADKNGNFTISNLKEGRYILMITHPYLGDYFDTTTIKANIANDLGTINMIPKSKLLAEVIIKSGSPIRIKGDTTVYTADSFQVREGANVEELLRRLPGIQVDKDGKITAMGEKVKKVLVDGEEFFGSDPGIATKNLRADHVKEVEVYDKKSDQAEFTGIDDGIKDKTINLKLKDDKKKGYFGKVEAGGGLKDKYDNSIMLNAFKGKRKIAAYGIMSNTGKTNLDWQDASNYGGGVDGLEAGVGDDGEAFMMYNGDDENNYRGGSKGIPQSWNGGLHYNNKFNNNKQSINGGYKFSKVNAPGVTSTFSKTFLPDTSWSTNSVSNNFTSNNKHAFNFTWESTIDSSNTLKWTTKANKNNILNRNNYYTESFTDKMDSINNSRRNSNNKGVNDGITTTLLWRHKFKKLARTLSINADLAWKQSKNNGFLYALNNYYQNGIIDNRDSINQQNIRNNDGKSISAKIA
ncbi:MAG: SpaA isopeptide-forming pilin-related protein, partial [Chitinophagaceae bacterium]